VNRWSTLAERLRFGTLALRRSAARTGARSFEQQAVERVAMIGRVVHSFRSAQFKAWPIARSADRALDADGIRRRE